MTLRIVTINGAVGEYVYATEQAGKLATTLAEWWHVVARATVREGNIVWIIK